MSLRRWLVVAMVVVPCAHAQVTPPAAPAPAKEATAAAGAKDAAEEPPAPRRRLKFKGERPTCTCVSALGEDDIKAAEAKQDKEPQTRRSEK